MVDWPGEWRSFGNEYLEKDNAIMMTLDAGPEYNGEIKVRNWPTFNETWAGIEEVYKKGKAKNIGVSNFSVKKYDSIRHVIM